MAKKVRGTSSTYRPGGLGPTRATKASVASMTTDPDLAASDAGADIDAAVDAVAMQQSELAITASTPAPSATRRSRRGMRVRADSLGARAAAEDTFVREDLRSIAMITLILLAGLLIAWVLLVPMNLAGLY